MSDKVMSQKVLAEIRNDTLEILASLSLIPGTKLPSKNGLNEPLNDLNLSDQASSQKEQLTQHYDSELIRDIRILAKEAGNDLKALMPSKKDPNVPNIEVEFDSARNEEMFNNIVRRVYQDLNELTRDFKASYHISDFKHKVELLERVEIREVKKSSGELENFLSACINLLNLAENYAKKIRQEDQRLGQDNKNLIEFLEKKLQRGDINEFYCIVEEGREQIGFEGFKEELEELTTFLEIEKNVSDDLNHLINEINQLKQEAKKIDQGIKDGMNQTNSKTRTGLLND